MYSSGPTRLPGVSNADFTWFCRDGQPPFSSPKHTFRPPASSMAGTPQSGMSPLVVEGHMTRRVTRDDKYSSSLHPCGRRLRRRRRRRDRNINNAIASVTTLLDADIHVGCTAVGGRHHNSGRGRRLLHRRGNAARCAIRPTSSRRNHQHQEKAPFAQHSNER